ncbi:hypothetical protein ASG01_02760 [Chryseobacterium sp. Leaf180]|nr:hypothetical protein ASG01_02760 [Chryseobacterium sp. Leaf180]
MDLFLLLICFFVIAFTYASVGFGGGSSYLAVLALFSLPYAEIRLTALLCNIIVVSGGVIIYVKNKQTDWKKILPITLVSVPLAFLGAKIKISQETFFLILGCTLIIAALLLWLKTSDKKPEVSNVRNNILTNGFLGGIIGFISGLVGIGGGIFLSPVLNLMHWDTAKKIAATASFFILVNSISGIFGQLSNLSHTIDFYRIGSLCVAVLVGGQLGARLSLNWNALIIKRMTALLVLIAGVNVLIKYW